MGKCGEVWGDGGSYGGVVGVWGSVRAWWEYGGSVGMVGDGGSMGGVWGDGGSVGGWWECGAV